MIQTPVLALPNFDAEFVIETGASGIGLGAVLQQGGHPIAYLSKTLTPNHQSLSTYEKSLWQKFNWSNEELKRKGKLVIGNNAALRTKLVTLFHSDHVGGHSGIQPLIFHILYVLGTSNVDKVDRTLAAREEAINVLKFYLMRAQDRTKEIVVGVFPTCADDGLLAVEPVKILDRRLQKRENAATLFVLMQWANSTPDDAT
nr:retrotransposable element Tf2 [Tanacetum cinerariifolium]